MADLFGSQPKPPYPDPWAISEAGNRTMMSGFVPAFNAAFQEASRRRAEAEDPVTALRRDHAVNQLAMDALEFRAAQLKEKQATDEINDRAVGMREYEDWVNAQRQNPDAPFTGTSEFGLNLATKRQAMVARSTEERVRLQEQIAHSKLRASLSSSPYVTKEALAAIDALKGDDGMWTAPAIAALDTLSTSAASSKLAADKAKEDQRIQLRRQALASKGPLALYEQKKAYLDAGDTEGAELADKAINFHFDSIKQSLERSLQIAQAQRAGQATTDKIRSLRRMVEDAQSTLTDSRVLSSAKAGLDAKIQAWQKEADDLYNQLQSGAPSPVAVPPVREFKLPDGTPARIIQE